jgi:low affinity Fe/Cu permease
MRNTQARRTSFTLHADIFHRFAVRCAEVVGSAPAFLVALIVVLVWATTGPLFGFSDTWQLIINTTTTIVTFLMVFLIQNTQNRDGRALHLKLDELIRSVQGARNGMINLERLTDDELLQLEKQFTVLQQRARKLRETVS